jgi:hypothetical protein
MRGSRNPGKVAALAQLRDAQRDRPGARVPLAVAVSVALHQALARLALAQGRVAAALDVQIHHPLANELDHVAQQIVVRALFNQFRKAHAHVGHRGGPRLVESAKPNIPKSPR